MDQQNCHHEKHAGNGFLLGVLVGVVVTLLFSTKKGREILKEMTDRGIKKWSDFENFTKEMEDRDSSDDEMDDGDTEYVAPAEQKEIRILAKQSAVEPKPEPKVEKKVEVLPKQDEKEEPVVHEEKKITEKTITGRRWFRGLRKKPTT